MAAKDPLPGYELLEVLGEGGMATVFKARQRATGRVCALKVLRDFDATEDRKERRLERFVREGALLERLDHPNVVRLISSGKDEGGAWMALDYVDGPSLEELLTREGGPLAVPVVLALMNEVARALDHLKTRRVIHRDVKPANIVITTGGAVKLVDFGIATSVDETGSDERPLLNHELPIGTIDYMAPEQVEEDEAIDERVDLFALGSTAYRCLAGMTPFTGETVFARLRELIEREPPPLPRNLPPSLAALVLSLLSKKAAGRPNAKEVEKTCERLAAVAGFKGEGWTRRALTDALSKPRPPRVEPGLALVVLSSEEITIERPLKVGEGFIIGRSLQDGVASTSIGRAWISRHHARVELGERGLVVTDMGSANGTFVNNLRLAPNSDALVKPGDKLTLGKTTLTVALENAPADLMAPLWKCLLCAVELPRDAGSTDDATGVEERHLCARCRSRMEEDRNAGEKRAREAIATLGGKVVKRIEIGGPILRFEVESQDKRKLAAHALDLGPSAATLYVERSKAAMTLDHPGILKARAVMASAGVLVIVTDPVTTRTAADAILRDGPLAPEVARRATITLAKACAHARSRGVTAIALRPQVVLLAKNGSVQLLDAGLAPALVEAGRSRVELGRSIPCYDAPESQGVRETTPRAVVYSLAACAHFFLTGEAPVELRSGGRRVSQPPLATRPEIPAALAQILDRALDADPARRTVGPEELATVLESLAPREGGAGDLGSRESTPAWGRKRPLAVTQELPAATFDDDPDATEIAGTMVLKLPQRFMAPLPPPLRPLPGMVGKPAPSVPSSTPQPVRVDLAARLGRLAAEKASGVLSIHGARARGRIELGAGKIVRVAAPQNIALDALAAVLAARDAATTFEPGAKLEPTAARVDITVNDALARAPERHVSGFDPHGSGDEGGYDPGGGYQDGEDAPDDESDSSRVADFPSFAIDLPTPKGAARSFVRLLFGASVVLGGIALFALDKGARGVAELTGLFALAFLALTFPAQALARQLDLYPRKGRVRLDRRGFKLPWLGKDVPGPEGPWEALRGFRVFHGKRSGGRTLVLEVAAGGFSLKDRWIGVEAFDAALSVLERALGPQGVLLGTVVRLPITPTDTRRLRERVIPTLLALGAMAAFLALATLALALVVKIAAFACAGVAVLAGFCVQAWDRPTGAELVLALDGLVVPLPENLSRTVKLPFAALRRGAVLDPGSHQVAIVIEHERGRLTYPLDWTDPREAREFVRQLSKHTT